MPKETAKNAKPTQATESKGESLQEQAEKKEKPVEAADNKADAVQERAGSKGKKCPKEPVYPLGELMENAKNIFNTRQECVSAALKAAGKEECSVAEAKEIVEKFLKREVG